MKALLVIQTVILALITPTIGIAGIATIDATVTNQFIRGFGAASAWDSVASLSPMAATFWADDTVNGHIGLSMLRTRIDPGGSGNWSTEAGPMTLALAQNPNILIWSTEWTPPAALKNNDDVDGPAANNTFNNTTVNSQTYASYLVQYVQWIKSNYGITLYAVSPQNEPDQNTSYESCSWTAGQFDDFIKNYMGPSFQSAGLTTKILMPEDSKDDLTMSNPTLNDSAAALFVGIVGAHLYGSGPTAYPLAASLGMEYWETEMSDVNSTTNDPTMTSGLTEAMWIHNSLVTANMNAYHHWWLVDDNADNEGLCDNTGAPTKKLYALGNFSKFIRPGYYRMGATAAPSTGVSVSAYKSSASSPTNIVIVAINNNSTTVSQTFALNGINTSMATPWLTNSGNSLVAQTVVPVSGNSFTYPLPPQSVVSFLCTLAVSPTATNSPSPTKTTTSSPTTTPTDSPTKTITALPTLTQTSTSTLSATPSFTPSTSKTFSPSSTLTATKTAVPSTETETKTATPSLTAAVTNTPTITPLLPSSTPTSTSSQSSTPVPPTLTSTATATPTLATSTSTDTPPISTLSPTATSTTFTLTASVTPFPISSTPTIQIPTATSTLTPISSSPTPTMPILSPTLSNSSTNTTTVTMTATPTATITTATSSPSPATFHTSTSTSTPTILFVASHTPSNSFNSVGPIAVLLQEAVPNPNPHFLQVKLESAADSVMVRLWSVSLRMLDSFDVSPVAAGWNTVTLPSNFLTTAPNGVYFFSVTAIRNGIPSAAIVPGRIVILR